MDECHTFGKCVYDHKINLGHSDLYSRSSDFLLLFFALKKHFSFFGKAQFRRAMLSCDSSYHSFFCSVHTLYALAKQSVLIAVIKWP